MHTIDKTQISELVSVELQQGYLEFKKDGLIIYDFRANDWPKFIPLLREKNWFTPELEVKSNLLVSGEVING